MTSNLRVKLFKIPSNHDDKNNSNNGNNNKYNNNHNYNNNNDNNRIIGTIIKQQVKMMTTYNKFGLCSVFLSRVFLL